MLVDTHAHNQWASFGKDREKVISRARIVDVKYIANIGFDVPGFLAVSAAIDNVSLNAR
jgi:Tat protein secretion system quality control protein TatD with DNase activity